MKMVMTLMVIGISILGSRWVGTISTDKIVVPPLEDAEMVEAVNLPAIPRRIVLEGGSHNFQTFNNCGPASLSMALSYFDITVSQTELGGMLRPYQNSQGNNDDKSVTFQELAAKVQDYGLVAFHRPAGSIALVEQLLAQGLPVLTRTWLSEGEDIGHYRLVKGYDQEARVLIQDDSLQGKNLSYSYDDFTLLWQAFNYEFLVLVPTDKQVITEKILGPLVDETSAWNQALATDASGSYASFNRAVALYYLGKYDESIQQYESVQAYLPPRMLWYQIEPILSYYQLGYDDQVMRMTTTILTTNNRAYSELHYLQGLVYQRQDKVDLANAAFEKADKYNQSPYWKQNVRM